MNYRFYIFLLLAHKLNIVLIFPCFSLRLMVFNPPPNSSLSLSFYFGFLSFFLRLLQFLILSINNIILYLFFPFHISIHIWSLRLYYYYYYYVSTHFHVTYLPYINFVPDDIPVPSVNRNASCDAFGAGCPHTSLPRPCTGSYPSRVKALPFSSLPSSSHRLFILPFLFLSFDLFPFLPFFIPSLA